MDTIGHINMMKRKTNPSTEGGNVPLNRSIEFPVPQLLTSSFLLFFQPGFNLRIEASTAVRTVLPSAMFSNVSVSDIVVVSMIRFSKIEQGVRDSV